MANGKSEPPDAVPFPYFALCPLPFAIFPAERRPPPRVLQGWRAGGGARRSTVTSIDAGAGQLERPRQGAKKITKNPRRAPLHDSRAALHNARAALHKSRATLNTSRATLCKERAPSNNRRRPFDACRSTFDERRSPSHTSRCPFDDHHRTSNGNHRPCHADRPIAVEARSRGSPFLRYLHPQKAEYDPASGPFRPSQ